VAYWLGDAGADVFKTVGVAGAVVFVILVLGGVLWLRRREHRRLHR
jgi:hypothetical protein